MTAQAAAHLITNIEFLVWLGAFVAATYARLNRKFSSVLCFLGIKLAMAGGYSYLTLFHPIGSHGWQKAYSTFFDFYWVGYFLATLAVFFSIEQIIRRVLSPLPGLSRLGVLIFRFTGILTLFIALTAHLSEMRSLSFDLWLQAFFVSFALCMCVFEVTLMSLLIATAQRLGLTFKTRIFGLSLGFCLLGIMDFLSLAGLSNPKSHWAGTGLLSELVVLATLTMWSVYFLMPEQRRGALMLNRSSPLMRWNEIVSQLGGPQPALDATPSFMADVESVVSRILERNQSRVH